MDDANDIKTKRFDITSSSFHAWSSIIYRDCFTLKEAIFTLINHLEFYRISLFLP